MTWLLLILFALVVAGCVVWIWYVWQSRFGNRMMDYDAREVALVMQARADLVPDKPPQAGASGRPAAEAPLRAAPAVEVAPDNKPDHKPLERVTPRPLLDEAEALLYVQLKSCVVEHPLLIGVDVARLLPNTEFGAPRISADFVVCRKDFTPVVAIFLARPDQSSLQDRAQQLLKQSTRIRVLKWDASTPPDREAMKQQIFKPKAN